MPAAPYLQSSYRQRRSGRERAVSSALSVALVLLLVWLLLRTGIVPMAPVGRSLQPATFTLSPESSPAREHSRAAPRAAPARPTEPKPPQPELRPPEQATPRPVVEPQWPTNMIVMSKDDFAAADVAKLPNRAPAGSGKAGTALADANGGAAKATYGPGEGPQGQTLYAADWYREPTDAELKTYMPAAGAPPGAWAMIACRTIADYHVENCRELGESPPGSGLSRALRRAAWQFLVIPPRVNGKPELGVWISIRFDFTLKPTN